MLALYIIGGILLSLFLLLMIPVYLTLDYDKKMRVDVGYLFLKINIIGDNRPQKAKKKTQKNAKKDQKKGKKENFLKEKFKEKSVSEIVSEVADLLKSALKRLFPLFKHIIVRKFYLALKIGGEDAEKTAITYGRVCSAVYPVRGMLAQVLDFRENKVFIKADFNSEKSDALLHLKLNFRPIFAVIAAVSFLFHYIISKIKNKTNKTWERATNE